MAPEATVFRRKAWSSAAAVLAAGSIAVARYCWDATDMVA